MKNGKSLDKQKVTAIGVDIETTGLDKNDDLLVEIAVIAIDKHGDIIDHYSSPVVPFTAQNENDIQAIRQNLANSYVRDMHDENGLWGDMIDSVETGTAKDLLTVESEIMGMLDNAGFLGYPVPLLGSSPGALDRPFIDRDFPEFSEFFSHRSIDASTLTEILERFHGYSNKELNDHVFEPAAEKANENLPDNAVKHRALFDVMVSLYVIQFAEKLIAESVK